MLFFFEINAHFGWMHVIVNISYLLLVDNFDQMCG